MLEEAPKPTNEAQASVITDELPVCGSDEDLISLCDIVITGMETEWTHWWTHKYDPNADGTHQSWGVIAPLPSAGKTRADGSPIHPVELWERVVRKAVYEYLLDRLNRGSDLAEARKMVDGSYTDAVVADSILQFALYGQEVYS